MNPTSQTNRNSAGALNMVLYIVGAVALATGVYVSTITRIDLFSGSTTHPYLGIGIPIAVVGLVLSLAGRLAAKRALSR